MLLFKRILDFRQSTLAQLRNKRKAPRYPVGPDFPLKGTINLCGLDSPAKIAAAVRGSGCDWAGSVANLSSCGASLLLPPAAITARGEQSTLRLAIGPHSLQLACIVTHFRVFSSHAVCGLRLEFDDYTVQKAFLQLHEAVRIGASLAPVKPPAFPRPPPGLRVEQYEADKQARLIVWRGIADGRIGRFELVLGGHSLRGETCDPALEICLRQGTGNPPASTTAEVRQLFRWVVPNLGKVVPADVRAFLKQAACETPAAREGARPASSRPSVPPTPPPHLNFGKPGPKTKNGAG